MFTFQDVTTFDRHFRPRMLSDQIKNVKYDVIKEKYYSSKNDLNSNFQQFEELNNGRKLIHVTYIMIQRKMQ